MPAKMLFGEEGFRWLRHNLVRRGFRLDERYEVKKNIERLGLVPQRPYRPMTAVFTYTANGYTVKVRTTYDPAAHQAIQSANGWVMILDGDVRLYTDRPLNRTAHFLERLLDRACIARRRVIHRPNCKTETCKAAMNIVRGKYPKQVFFACPNGHGTIPWDEPLPAVVREYVEMYRKERRRTDARTRAMGKEPHQAMFKRAKNPPWLTTRPQNKRYSGPPF